MQGAAIAGWIQIKAQIIDYTEHWWAVRGAAPA